MDLYFGYLFYLPTSLVCLCVYESDGWAVSFWDSAQNLTPNRNIVLQSAKEI